MEEEEMEENKTVGIVSVGDVLASVHAAAWAITAANMRASDNKDEVVEEGELIFSSQNFDVIKNGNNGSRISTLCVVQKPNSDIIAVKRSNKFGLNSKDSSQVNRGGGRWMISNDDYHAENDELDREELRQLNQYKEYNRDVITVAGKVLGVLLSSLIVTSRKKNDFNSEEALRNVDEIMIIMDNSKECTKSITNMHEDEDKAVRRFCINSDVIEDEIGSEASFIVNNDVVAAMINLIHASGVKTTLFVQSGVMYQSSCASRGEYATYRKACLETVREIQVHMESRVQAGCRNDAEEFEEMAMEATFKAMGQRYKLLPGVDQVDASSSNDGEFLYL